MKLYKQKEANKKCEGGGTPVTIHSNVTGSVMFMNYLGSLHISRITGDMIVVRPLYYIRVCLCKQTCIVYSPFLCTLLTGFYHPYTTHNTLD